MGSSAYAIQEARRRNPAQWRALNRAKGKAARSTARKLALANVQNKETRAALLEVPEKLQMKIIQNAIKPLLGEARRAWRAEIKSAKTSKRTTAFQRRYNGISLRQSLAKSIKVRNPKGSGSLSSAGWVVLAGGTTKHGKRGEAVSNAGQAAWLEFGTDAHSLRRNRRHPGTDPLIDYSERLQRMNARAGQLFERAIKAGIKTGGKRMTTKSVREFMGVGK